MKYLYLYLNTNGEVFDNIQIVFKIPVSRSCNYQLDSNSLVFLWHIAACTSKPPVHLGTANPLVWPDIGGRFWPTTTGITGLGVG